MLATTEIAEIKGLVKKLNDCAPILREINTKSEHQQALELMEVLIEDYDDNLVVIGALTDAIARYEDGAEDFTEFNQSVAAKDAAVATLKVLMDQHGLNTTDFENEIGKKSMVSQVLSGTRRLSRDHIERLSKRFDISPALFFD